MKSEKTRSLREGAMMVAITAVLMLLNRYMPLFSVIGIFLCGIPMAILAARSDVRVVICAIAATFLVSVLIDGDIISAVSLMLMSVIPGGAAGYMMGKKKPFFTTLFTTCVCVCLGWVFELAMLELFSGSGIDEMFSEMMKQFEATFAQMTSRIDQSILQNSGIPDNLATDFLEVLEYTTRLYFPSMVVICSMLNGYIIIRLSGFFINRTGLGKVDNPPFSHLKAPQSLSFVAVILYLVFAFTGNNSTIYPVLANIVTILYTILGICGLAIVDFKLKAKIKRAPLRFGIYIAVFFLGSVFITIICDILIILSIIDARRDFRHLEASDGNL